MLCPRCKSPTCTTVQPQHSIIVRGVRAGNFICDAEASHSAGRGICPLCIAPAAKSDLENSKLAEILLGHDDFEKAAYAVDMNRGRANNSGARFSRPQLTEIPYLTVWKFDNFRGPFLDGLSASEFGSRFVNSMTCAGRSRFPEVKVGRFTKIHALEIFERRIDIEEQAKSSGIIVASDGVVYRKIGIKRNDVVELETIPAGSAMLIPSGTSALFGNF